MGAWIETFPTLGSTDTLKVAPLVGAWIETDLAAASIAAGAKSLPSWERGLKPDTIQTQYPDTTSLPSWERGLKLLGFVRNNIIFSRSPRGSVD